MIGPTGVGKTEIARRLAKLDNSPFLKIEASKFTEVGYVGRDVDSMIRDLMEIAVSLIKQEEMNNVRARAKELAEDRILDLLLPMKRAEIRSPEGMEGHAGDVEAGPVDTREKLRQMLREGKLDSRVINLEITEKAGGPMIEVFSSSGVEDVGLNIKEMFGNIFPQKKTTIPVVVHVVYKTAVQNISAAQIQSQIDVLNEDFRHKNADLATVPAPFAPVTADARTEFKLASTDPAGNPTTGITRTATATTAFSDDDSVKSAATGGADAWPSDRYLNIWVCPLAGGLLGYVQFPGGPAATDGVVIRHSAFGTSGRRQRPSISVAPQPTRSGTGSICARSGVTTARAAPGATPFTGCCSSSLEQDKALILKETRLFPNPIVYYNGYRKTGDLLTNNIIKNELNRIQSKGTIIGMIARLEIQKRVDRALELFGSLLVKRSDLYLLIFGDGSLKEELVQKTKYLGIASNVIFFDYTPEITSYYSYFDMLLFTSDWEGMPLTMWETLANEVPVIAPDVGGFKEILEKNNCGLIYEPGNIMDAESKLIRLLDDVQLRKSLGKNGRTAIESKYTEQIFIRQIEKVYEDLVNR